MGTGRHVSWKARGHLAVAKSSGHANLLFKYRSHATENIWRESIGKPMGSTGVHCGCRDGE